MTFILKKRSILSTKIHKKMRQIREINHYLLINLYSMKKILRNLHSMLSFYKYLDTVIYLQTLVKPPNITIIRKKKNIFQ
jgi:hypothetical protein